MCFKYIIMMRPSTMICGSVYASPLETTTEYEIEKENHHHHQNPQLRRIGIGEAPSHRENAITNDSGGTLSRARSTTRRLLYKSKMNVESLKKTTRLTEILSKYHDSKQRGTPLPLARFFRVCCCHGHVIVNTASLKIHHEKKSIVFNR
jgi:hypothetical protein